MDANDILGLLEAQGKKLNWKRVGVYALVILLLFGAGAATGHWVTPPKTVVTTKVQTVEKQVVVTQVQTKLQTVYVHDKQKDEKVHRVIVATTTKDGTTTKTTTEDINTDTTQHTDVNANKAVATTTDTTTNKTEKEAVTKKVTNPADWRVAAGLGLSIPSAIGHAQLGVPGLHSAVIQLELDRRVLGPFFMGVWANSQGTAGVSLSGVF